MPMRREVRILAPAKINLILRVLDRRPDGYHNLWSLMQTVGLEDELCFRLCPERAEIRLECNDPSLPTDGRNLVMRAAGLVMSRAALAVGLDIRIVKRIPISAGLGGGSSDAAATIAGLNRLLGLKWSIAEMAKLAQTLGSDVPFFFFAPTAQVRGRGEDVVPLRLTGDRWLVLVNPGFPIETRWAYDCLAAMRNRIPPLSEAIGRLSRKECISWDEVIPLLENDFESALASTHQVLGQMKAELIASGAEAALLSGSGATVFGIFRSEAAALSAQNVLRQAYGWWTCAAKANGQSWVSRESASFDPLRVG